MKVVLTLGLALLCFISCNKNSAPDDSKNEISALLKNDLRKVDNELKASTDSTSAGGMILQGSAPQPDMDWDKKIIRTATLKIEVKDFKIYSASLHNLIKQSGGYISKEEQQHSDESLASNIVIKVPVANFESLVNSVSETANKVEEKTINSEDVTGAVVDTKSRLLAKEQMKLRYMEFLKNSKNMSEVLQVQAELNKLQEDIETAATHVTYLSNQSAFSTIVLNFHQPLTQSSNKVDNPPTFMDRVFGALKTGAGFFAELFIAILTVWPIWTIVLIGFFIWKKNKKINVQVTAK